MINIFALSIALKLPVTFSTNPETEDNCIQLDNTRHISVHPRGVYATVVSVLPDGKFIFGAMHTDTQTLLAELNYTKR